MAAETDIQDRFSPNKPLEQDVLYEIQSILRLHALSVDDLFFKWDAYCIKMDLEAQLALSLPNLRHLKQSIQDELEKSHRATQARAERKVNAAPRGGVSAGDVFGMLDGLVPSTPAMASRSGNRGVVGSGLKKKMGGLKVNGSPAGMNDQIKALDGLPYVDGLCLFFSFFFLPFLLFFTFTNGHIKWPHQLLIHGLPLGA